MGARITDEKRKMIIADYLELESYRAVGRKHNVSQVSVKRIVESCNDIEQKIAAKKEQNTAEILAHMEKKKTMVNQIIDRYLEALLDEKKIATATTSQLTTAMGTLIDKWTQRNIWQESSMQQEDDPITAALKEEAKNGTL